MPPTPPPVHDYIIVGAGSAGCVLAHRLSADPKVRVLLLEAGPNDSHPFLHMPAAAGKLRGRGMTWDDTTAPQPPLAGRTLRWPHGKVLGGSSAIDAMCYTRGAPADYDDWAAHGAEGWAWRDVLPWFRHAEGNGRGRDPLHGSDGPLTVSDLRHVDPHTRRFIEAGQQAGLPANADFNGPDPHGVGLYQVTQRDGARCSAATAYLDRATRARPNLTIVTGARVNRVTFEHGRANGVVYASARGAFHQPATREVLLCGGAVNSPQLLMLSGIGPALALRRHGLPVVHDAPDVGRNLQDALGIRIALPSDCPPRHRRMREAAIAWNYFVRGRRGAGTSNGFEAGGFFRSPLAGDDRADIQFHFAPAQLDAHDPRSFDAGCSLRACVLRPRSRGDVRLTGNRISDRPRIDPGYLSDPAGFDLRMLVECARIARTILAQAAFDGIRNAPLPPGDAASDDELAAFVRDQAESVLRAAGTCRMGTDDQAVVDPQLRVRGVAGLRVVDASVIPTLPGGDLNAPVVMLAERAAALILQA
ncbi:GMC family oxidoreductase N-terminal domain-containing protein [Luteimonas sp. RC10]|uniref:GMC family oxidoreductase n=1 Tax=Luteimonas sp. RC10 TaxID=2587035 RepID=UPI00161D4074|nr:GMC family oxidoreductase N-terminal domain-containing protein [Luteimonas sp. RC10]MBB3345019.1 choline dehydrogenase [Luteimonas sp. RC10]